jgi:hypothetical protein
MLSKAPASESARAKSAKSGLSEILIVTAFMVSIYPHGKSSQGLPRKRVNS